jgi:glycosyltransferase involved in cell wall biosynthesis
MQEKRMRIIYVCDDLMIGGWSSLADMILKFKKEGDTVSVVTLFGKGYYADILEKNGINVLCLEMNKKNFLWSFVRLLVFFRKESLDIVHTNLHYSDIFGIAAAFLAGVKGRVIQIHSIGEKYKHQLGFLKRFVLSKATAVSAVSGAAAEAFRREYPSFSGAISVVPNGIDICEFRRRVAESKCRKSDFGIPENVFTVLTVANFKWQKGYEYLVEAAALLDKASFRFLVAGHGPEHDRIKKMIAEKNIGDKIILLGARTDVPELMNIADAFLLPSVVEPFGICVIEAFAAGLPVIATAVDGIKETASHMNDAILVNPASPGEIADAIMMLRQNPELGKKIAEAALKKSDQFDVGRTCERIRKIYYQKKSFLDFSC